MVLFNMKCTRFLLALLFINSAIGKMIQKRQLFREQVLPSLGGKVPESAFWTDRLALNQINAKGIYSSTGVYLEHRLNKHHSHERLADHMLMQVLVPQEDRFVAPAGRYYYESSPKVDTTYLIRDPITTPIKWSPLSQSHPLIPYTSLKLTRHYNQRRKQEKNKDSPWNEVGNTKELILKVKKEFEPYLKKLHEVD